VNRLSQTLQKPIGVVEYLRWSTAAIPLMFLIIGRLGADIMLGYPFIVANSLILLILDKLRVHRNHIVALLAVSTFSLVGGTLAETPITAQASQILGISVVSIYFFCALAVLGPSVRQWMDMYARIAFGVAVYGIAHWGTAKLFHMGDGRLTSFYAEPSNFVYTTLPAIGYFINCYVTEKRYGPEAAIFILSYLLAESSLGFMGLSLIGIFTFGRRVKGWQVVLAFLLFGGFLAGLYFGSTNVRIRAQNMALALSTQDISKANGTTFAFLSNVYISSQAFAAHPLTGVGIGGYSNIYDTYIAELTGIKQTDPDNLNLNRSDANSLFLRVAAELGAPGLIVLLSFLIIFGRVRGLPYQTMRNALLPYLIVRMWRYGAYFSVEVYFFAGLYLFNYLNYCQGALRPPNMAKPPPLLHNAAQVR
jgi:hypothetical protein